MSYGAAGEQSRCGAQWTRNGDRALRERVGGARTAEVGR